MWGCWQIRFGTNPMFDTKQNLRIPHALFKTFSSIIIGEKIVYIAWNKMENKKTFPKYGNFCKKRFAWSFHQAQIFLFLTPNFFKRALLNYWGVSNQSQTGMDERPIWVHKFSRKKQIPHGSIHPLPQHILLVKFRTVKTKMMIKSSFFFQKLNSIDR